MRRRLLPRLLPLALVLALLGGGMPPPRAGAAAIRTITVGVLGLPTTLNPLLNPAQGSTVDITDAIFDSLLSTNVHDGLQPDLAASYTINPAGTRYQFTLNPRARWQDGTPVTAADVLFTAKLMRDPAFPAYNRFGFGNIATIAATGDLTVTVTLRAPYAPFLRAFATTPILPAHVLAPLPIDQIAQYATFNRRPVGSGPYEVTGVANGDQMTLTANSSYFLGAPHVQTLVFRVEPSLTAAMAALRAGTVDLLGPSVGITPQQLLGALGTGRLNAFAAPGYGWTHIDLIESGFLRDHLVRQALAYATPRQRIVATLFKGLVTQADADQPPTSQYYNPNIAGSFPYDPAKVSALLRSRGYTRVKGHYVKAGRTLSITLWLDSSCDDCEAVATMVAASWRAAGIPTTLRAVPTHTLFGPKGPLYSPDRLTTPTLNAVLYTWLTLPEPDDSAYWDTSMIVRPGHETGLNFDGYSDPEVDQLTSRALSTASEARRIYDYQAIQELLVRDQPDIFLYWTPHLSLAAATLHGYQANPFHPGVTWDAAGWQLG